MVMKQINVTITEIKNKINLGYTWFKSEDKGFGSIQQDYELVDFQVELLKKHPKLKDVSVQELKVILNIIDEEDSVETLNESAPTFESTPTVKKELKTEVKEEKESNISSNMEALFNL